MKSSKQTVRRERRKFSAEFKAEAVRLMTERRAARRDAAARESATAAGTRGRTAGAGRGKKVAAYFAKESR